MAERPRNVAAQRWRRAHVSAGLCARRENLFRRVDNAPRRGQVGCWSWQQFELSELLPHLWRPPAPPDSESLIDTTSAVRTKGGIASDAAPGAKAQDRPA